MGFGGYVKREPQRMSMGVYDADTRRWVVFAFMYWLGLGVTDVFSSDCPRHNKPFSVKSPGGPAKVAIPTRSNQRTQNGTALCSMGYSQQK